MHKERERISVTFHSNNGSPYVFASRLTHEQVLPGKQLRAFYRYIVRIMMSELTSDSTRLLEIGLAQHKFSKQGFKRRRNLSCPFRLTRCCLKGLTCMVGGIWRRFSSGFVSIKQCSGRRCSTDRNSIDDFETEFLRVGFESIGLRLFG